jgi:HD-like signal output (HDOD) protein
MQFGGTNARAKELVANGAKELPPFPTALSRLLEATQSDTVTAADLESILGTDPAIATKTLRVVNSPYYGLPRQVRSLNQAVIILGVRQLRNLSLGLGALGNLQPKSKDGQALHQQLWQHSVETAMTGKICVIAAGKSSMLAEEAFLLGLLHDVGRLFILATETERTNGLATEIDLYDDNLLATALGAFPHEIGYELLQLWNLPPVFAEGVLYVGTGAGSDVPSVAVRAGHAILDGQNLEAISAAGIMPTQVEEIRQRVEAEREALGALMGAA